jgi:hypothetical protein
MIRCSCGSLWRCKVSELGRTEEALQVLSKIVDISSKLVAARSVAHRLLRAISRSRPEKGSFLPAEMFPATKKPARSRQGCKRMSSALCFTVAALTADISLTNGTGSCAEPVVFGLKSLQTGLVDILERDSSTAYIEFLQNDRRERSQKSLGTQRRRNTKR